MSIIGTILRVSTFGQSHSKAVGCTIQGFPANFKIDFEKVQKQLDRRKPGQSSITTTRKQTDKLKILSGIQNDRTLGSPICLLVENEDFKVGDYKSFLKIPRPGHADFTYKLKYGIVAQSGGGRSSARQTVGRVLAGALCKQYLQKYGIFCSSWVKSVNQFQLSNEINKTLINDKIKADKVDLHSTLTEYQQGFSINNKNYDREGRITQINQSIFIQKHVTRCPHDLTSIQIVKAIQKAKQNKDSLGGVIQGCIYGIPIGLGRPVFDKFPALLSQAMLSIPATKGFEYGSGFAGTQLLGSDHNDLFIKDNQTLRLKTNNSGGTLGGITTGQTFHFKVAFKPASTIGKKQITSNYQGNETQLQGHGRHDPCVLPRAVPIIDAMSAIVTVDELLHYQINQ